MMNRILNPFLCSFISYMLLSFTVIPEIVLKPKSPEGKLALSDLVESVEYLPLETKNNCLIGRVSRYDISENYILVQCGNTQSVYFFDRKGKFIAQVGRKGEGPGEYHMVAAVFIDESENKLIIRDSLTRRLMYYDFKGKYLYAKEAKNMQLIIDFHKGYFIAGDCSHEKVPSYTFEIRDRELQLLTQAVESRFTTNPLLRLNPTAFTYEYKDHLYVKEMTLNDTIYQTKNYQILPYIRINAREYEMTPEDRSMKDMHKYFDTYRKCIVLRSIAESDDNMFFSYSYQEVLDNYIYYDKNSKETYAFQSKTGIPNDYDGGIAFWPQKQRNKTWYAFYPALQFEEELAEQKRITPKGPQEAIAKFNGLMKKLDPEDNPVLVIVKLK